MKTPTPAESNALTDVQGEAQIVVPLNQLVLHKNNVRKTKPTQAGIESLAASILANNLLQNLLVVKQGKKYAVVGGGRRLLSLQWLVKENKIVKDFPVRCMVVKDADAVTVSLAENVQREAMHPADEFFAFAELEAAGLPIEDIAARFGMTPVAVNRRLRLANVSPKLIADYRAGNGVTLEQLMVLAGVTDHARQEAAFYGAQHYERNAHALRMRLAEGDIPAWSNSLAQFVGVDAYVAAGGPTRQDLFAENGKDVYLLDPDLLKDLVLAKLEPIAAEVRGDGLKWVEVRAVVPHEDVRQFARLSKVERAMTSEEAEKAAALEVAMSDMSLLLDDAEDDENYADLEEKYQALEAELDALKAGLLCFDPAMIALSGALITVENGKPVIHRNLLLHDDARKIKSMLAKQAQQDAGEQSADGAGEAGEAGGGQSTSISETLAQRLSAHRTGAMQIELARHPHVALVTVVFGLAKNLLPPTTYENLSLNITASYKMNLAQVAPDWDDSPAAVALAAEKEKWQARLPFNDPDALFQEMMAMDDSELVELLALCTAMSVDLTTSRAPFNRGERMTKAVGFDMAKWWAPTAAGYFSHLNKAGILADVALFAPSDAGRLASMKKAEMATEAERLVAGTGWMPAAFGKSE